MVKRCIWVSASAAALLACSGTATTTSESVGEPTPKLATNASKGSGTAQPVGVSRAREALDKGLNLPPSAGKPPEQIAFLDRCPDEKSGRQDFKQLSLAKAKDKEVLEAKAPQDALDPKLGTPDAKYMAAQESFLAAVKKKQRAFDAMKPEAREQAYSDLKASLLGGEK